MVEESARKARRRLEERKVEHWKDGKDLRKHLDRLVKRGELTLSGDKVFLPNKLALEGNTHSQNVGLQ